VRPVVLRMNDKVTHSGSDDSGVWVEENIDIVLEHRRLSIIDLSAQGRHAIRKPG
jgi:asparagine synthetase B (glutamine-hydrolysing)